MENLEYWHLFIIFIIAWLVPLTLSWLQITKVPSVIVEIIMGVMVGPFVLGMVEASPVMDFMAETGFMFLIFLAGLEIDVTRILSSFPRGKLRSKVFYSNSLLIAVFIYFGSLVLSLPVAWIIHQFFDFAPVFYALLLPTVALSMTVPILKADGELSRKFGQIILMEGAIATIMSIILISIYSGVIKNGFRVELLLFTVIFVAFFVAYLAGKRLIRVRRFQYLQYRLEHAASQIRVRGTVALAMGFVVIAHLIETELIMGAFFAGILLSIFINKERSALIFKLDSMSYGFFIPIFFIMVGVKLDLSALTHFQESIPFIFTLIAAFFIIQIVPALIMAKVFGWKKALSGGALLTSRLGLTIATSQIGLSLGAITPAAHAGVVAASIVTSLLSPLLYKILSKEGTVSYQIYLLGGSRASLMLAERFKMHEFPCLTVLQNAQLAAEFDQKSIPHRLVPALDFEVIKNLGIRPADLVITLTGHKKLNHDLALYIVQELDHHKILTRKQNASRQLLNSSADLKLIDHEEVLASYIEDMIVRPEAIDSISTSFGMYRIEEIRVKRQELHRKMVKEVAFPPSGSLVMVRRGEEIFIPHGGTNMHFGDLLTVIGNQTALSEFRKILE